MVNWIWQIYPCGLNKGFGSKFWTHEESQKMHQLKRCEYNNKNEDKKVIKIY